ncbi:MAG: hypothetical protein OQK68_06710 [Sedimenticola sp.]|nr:hypothetical protein [Sedimenticola sp.]
MGMLDKWFGGMKDYPPLAADSQARHYLDEFSHELEGLAGDVKDPLEVVPSDHEAFVFIGKPPKRFGLAWIHDGKVSSFQSLIQERQLSAEKSDRLLEELRGAYQHALDAPRYSATVGDRKITITPSLKLEQEVHEIIHHT